MRLRFGRAAVAAGLAWLTVAAPSAAAERLDPAQRALVETIETKLLVARRADGGAVTATLAERMAASKVPAVSIAYIDNGRIVWTRAYGEARPGSAALTSTPFQAASLSKPVTAAAALRMVERRELSLDADIARAIVGWKPPAGSPITLRQLLSHTAGLTVSGYAGYRRDAPIPTTVQSLAGTPPANSTPVRSFVAPGTKFAYSGGGFTVAQLLMGERARVAFPQLVARLVLRPAGMKRSTFEQAVGDRAAKLRAFGHDENGQPLPGGSHVYPELAAAGLWTTPSDYARFVIELQRAWTGTRGALLTQASAREMIRPVTPGYGLGIGTMDRGGRPAITHSGGNEGFRTVFLAFLDGRREGVVVMTNGDGGGRLLAEIMRTLGRANGWVEPEPSARERAPD